MCLATSNNLLLVLQDVPKRIFFPMKSRSSGQQKKKKKKTRKTQRHFFPTLHPLYPAFFATATVVAFVLLRNSRFSFHCYAQHEGPELTLRPLATSCAKDHKGHSLVQTNFTEPPNRSLCQYLHHKKLASMPPLAKPDVLLVMIILTMSTCLL